MKKRLQFYLNYYETLTTEKSLTTAEKESLILKKSSITPFFLTTIHFRTSFIIY